jgi:hypothetical protein
LKNRLSELEERLIDKVETVEKTKTAGITEEEEK